MLSDLASRLLNQIQTYHQGAGKPIFSKELERTHVAAGSVIRDAVRELRRAGYPIGNSDKGYYFCTNSVELDALVGDLEGRAKSLFTTISALKRNYENPAFQQTRLF